MKNIFYIIPLFIAIGCGSSEPSSIVAQDVTQPDVVIAKKDILADSKVILEIAGMTCEMGCVSTIRNHVTQMKGNTNFEMDFNTERETDFATIEFDSRLLTTDEITAEIESIAQGIYSVINIENLD